MMGVVLAMDAAIEIEVLFLKHDTDIFHDFYKSVLLAPLQQQIQAFH
jgi:hypothetical protein